MKRWLLAAVALQLAVLGWLAGEREFVVRFGRPVYLRTAPLDPRDAMRGDYVRLDYEISAVPRTLFRGSLASTNVEERPKRDTVVYAVLEATPDGVAELKGLTDRRPTEGDFLRGRVRSHWGEDMRVRYGIEALFMQQGTAYEIEKQRLRDGIFVPLEVEVALGGGGLGVIRDWRWCALGMGVEFITETQRVTRAARVVNVNNRVIGAEVTLLNASRDKQVAVVETPHAGTLELALESQWGLQRVEVLPRAPVPVSATNVIVLKPGQQHRIHVDFAAPEWTVNVSSNAGPAVAMPLASVPPAGSQRYRLIYRAPSREACRHLPNAPLIWHGRLQSRAFTMGGSVD